MECRRHRTGPDSDEISRRRRTGLVRDNQTGLDCGVAGYAERSSASRPRAGRRRALGLDRGRDCHVYGTSICSIRHCFALTFNCTPGAHRERKKVQRARVLFWTDHPNASGGKLFRNTDQTGYPIKTGVETQYPLDPISFHHGDMNSITCGKFSFTKYEVAGAFGVGELNRIDFIDEI
jgi:hypothetical protein